MDPRTRDNVSIELKFVNSNLQLLKEQLSELNSSVELYQSEGEVTLPMIPLGLKETKELELESVLKPFIESHYHERGEDYESAIADLMDLRQAMRTPSRDSRGIAVLFQYCNHLHFLERRFLTSEPDDGCKLHFEWWVKS